jgi:hypothetical protein
MRRAPARRLFRPNRQQRQRLGKGAGQADRRRHAQLPRRRIQQVEGGPGLFADQAPGLVEQALQDDVIRGPAYRIRQDVVSIRRNSSLLPGGSS